MEVAHDHVRAAEREIGIRKVQRTRARRRSRTRCVRLRAAGLRSAAAGLGCGRRLWRGRSGVRRTLARHRQAARVLRIEEAFRPRPRRHQLHAARGHAGITDAGLQVDARIVRIRGLLLCNRSCDQAKRGKSRNRQRFGNLVRPSMRPRSLAGAPCWSVSQRIVKRPRAAPRTRRRALTKPARRFQVDDAAHRKVAARSARARRRKRTGP